MRKAYAIVSVVLFVPFLLLIVADDVIDSKAWLPPTAPLMSGVFSTNNKLLASELLAVGKILGPEDVAIDAAGRIYGGTQDGKIVRVRIDAAGGERVEEWVDLGSRPLGLHFDMSGNLIVADAIKGLLSIDKQANVTVLATEAEGVPFGFADDLDVAADGKIYFTDASSKWSHHEYKLDLLETVPYGRFLVFDPASGVTTVLARDLYFPNGVAVSANQQFVLINETWRYRTLRFWLNGPQAGTLDVFVDNLPGWPDGISTGSDGRFWLALASIRTPALDWIHPYSRLKNLSAKLPEFMQLKPTRYGFVLGLNEAGEVIENLQDPLGERLHEITSVQEHAGYLYFGTLSNDRIGRLRLAQ